MTFNLKDFPAASTEGLGITVVSPDAFLLEQIDLYPAKVGRALIGQVEDSSRPHLTLGGLLGRLARAGGSAFAEEARRHEFGTFFDA